MMSGNLGLESLIAGLWVVLTVVGPILACVLVGAIVISLFQASTQLQDPTLATIPRLVIGAVALLYLLPWIVDRLGEFTRETIARAGG